MIREYEDGESLSDRIFKTKSDTYKIYMKKSPYMMMRKTHGHIAAAIESCSYQGDYDAFVKKIRSLAEQVSMR